jgi:hypothetical protein
MERSTIHAWVQRCPGCGACASDLSKVNAFARNVVKRAEYLVQLKDTEFPELANSFICKSIIDEHKGKFSSATWALIHATWACDDHQSTPQAIICRKRAATMLRKAEAKRQATAKQHGVSTAILVDLLRRADALDEAAETIEKTKKSFSEKVLVQVLHFQKELIETGDLGCYTVREALCLGTQTQSVSSSFAWEDPVTSKRWWQFWR